MLPDEQKSIVQEINDPLLDKFKIRMLIKRDDLIHPEISGNKWRKLKYNLEAARKAGHHTLLTFGGPFSNHLAAVASAGTLFEFNTIGVVRGEAKYASNPTLARATAQGMKLHFVDRETYRQKHTQAFLDDLRQQFGDFYPLPEGGTNCLALKGSAEILSQITVDFDLFCCSMGTGGTFTGILPGLSSRQQALGFSSLKGDFLNDEVAKLMRQCAVKPGGKWAINSDYHFGGYARYNDQLVDFINQFHRRQQFLLDPIYTGKLLFGLFDLVRQSRFTPGSTLMVLHSGGLQGIRGFNEVNGNLIDTL